MDKNQRFVFLFVALLVTALYAFQLIEQPFGYGDVSVEESVLLFQAIEDLIILDVRTQGEYDSAHLENAILIPVDELEGRIGELSIETPLLIYCRTGNRSSIAVDILRDKGFTKIYHMAGGITAWEAAGYPVI